MSEFQNTDPERGRKLHDDFSFQIHNIPISEHEPRKGAETRDKRKNRNISCTFHNTPPERGRKHINSLICHLPVPHFGTRISKGDGTGYDFLLMKSQSVVYVLSLQCILLMLN